MVVVLFIFPFEELPESPSFPLWSEGTVSKLACTQRGTGNLRVLAVWTLRQQLRPPLISDDFVECRICQSRGIQGGLGY